MTENSVTLYCEENGSDKIYKAEVVQEGAGWTVRFQFGPRTGTLQSGTKTKSPVSKEEAIRLFEKLVREKKAKGYHEGADAPAYTEVDGTSKDTGLRPMLLTPATEEDLPRFIDDDSWGAQEKLNGKRVLIQVEDGRATGVNRRGLACAIPTSVALAMSCPGRWVFDGELVGEIYHAFDLLEAPSACMGRNDQRRSRMEHRHAFLKDQVERVLHSSPHVQLVSLTTGSAAKRNLVASLRAGRKEGAVFKRLDAGYDPGRIENLAKATAIKVKFYSSGEFLVSGWNTNRQSITLGVYGPDVALVQVGNVTVPTKYAGEIRVGGVVQVRYLYATSGHRLYQPTLDASSGSVSRNDKRPAECLLAQLKYEGGD